jgi:hypothetical protein
MEGYSMIKINYDESNRPGAVKKEVAEEKLRAILDKHDSYEEEDNYDLKSNLIFSFFNYY